MYEIYPQCMPDKESAMNIFDMKNDWVKGNRFGILYRDWNNDVQIILAVGIKDASECGPHGIANEDEWINTYYEHISDVHGKIFYRIVGDSGYNNTSNNYDNESLYTTTININKAKYEVLNGATDVDISDIFEVQEI